MFAACGRGFCFSVQSTEEVVVFQSVAVVLCTSKVTAWQKTLQRSVFYFLLWRALFKNVSAPQFCRALCAIWHDLKRTKGQINTACHYTASPLHVCETSVKKVALSHAVDLCVSVCVSVCVFTYI